ncbi:MAG: hypothetical protein AMXMBFR64_04140 [Myxococcales bacterium]
MKGALLTLALWMDAGLYDPHVGYYTAGRVRFGAGHDFWTYPERLSPTFGRLVASRLARMLAHLEAHGGLPPGEPFTVVELGAGDGTLARDICDAALEEAPRDPLMRRLEQRLRYLIGERSPSLRRVQQATCASHGARVAHLPQESGDELPEAMPWRGVLLSNELIDVFAHHRVRPLERTLLALEPRVSGREEPLGLAELLAKVAPQPLTVTPRWALLDSHPDAPLISPYLEALAPVVARRAAAHPAPADLLVAPGVTRLARWTAEHLLAGWALTIDYGGTPVHAMDPEPTMPHLRVYPRPAGADERSYGGADAVAELGWPGTQDITAEIDFGHLAWEGERAGLRPVHFGPQGHLREPGGLIDPMDRSERARVEAALVRKYAFGQVDAAMAAWEVARAFRDRSPGFRLLLQQARVPVEPFALGHPTDPIRIGELAQLRPGVTAEVIVQALATAGLPPDVARALRPWGCPVADLDDAGLREHTRAVLAALGALLA